MARGYAGRSTQRSPLGTAVAVPAVSSATRACSRSSSGGRHAEPQRHAGGVRRVEHRDPPRPQLALDPARVGVVDVDHQLADQVAAQRAGGVETGAYGVAVRAHQASRAQQGAAEPAGDHGDRVAHAPAAEHLEHRGARGAGGLPVVAGALDLGRPGWPEDERGAVVARVQVLPAEPLDDRPRGRLVLDPLERAEEPGPPDLDLGAAVPGERQVRRHGVPQSPRTSPPIRTMKQETIAMKKTRTKREPRETAVRAPT